VVSKPPFSLPSLVTKDRSPSGNFVSEFGLLTGRLHHLGETWNLMKIGYQLKQVRERLAKGLVDKGILRTEKRNFLLFDMATHPVADGGAKEEIRRRVRNVLTQRTIVLNGSQFLPENLEYRYLRTIAMVCAAYAANVLENALSTLGHEARERAFAQTDELLAEYSQWPFGKKATTNGIGANLPQVIGEVRLPHTSSTMKLYCPRYFGLSLTNNAFVA
jgi:hypothetical protein